MEQRELGWKVKDQLVYHLIEVAVGEPFSIPPDAVFVDEWVDEGKVRVLYRDRYDGP